KYIDSPRIPALPACEKDIEEMEKFFKANADNTLILINEDVTKEKIFDLFYNYLPAHTNPGDEIIIYWTGHGARCSDMSGDEEDGYDETLILYDSKAHEPETQLIDDDFGRWAQNLSGRKVLFLMDTCHSEGMANNAKGLVANVNWSPDYEWDFGLGECGLVKDLGQPNLAVIASCSQDQVSLIRKGEDMSVMTWCMIECLKENPPINQKQLYEKIKNPVSDYVKEVYGIRQNVGIQDAFESPMILNPQKLNPQKLNPQKLNPQK
ncbi:MAG: caspase family protein, partial [Thermoguttaceae bacterium]|nr:caspase family protein [Thermoguttaceae bacterium]